MGSKASLLPFAGRSWDPLGIKATQQLAHITPALHAFLVGMSQRRPQERAGLGRPEVRGDQQSL